MYWQLSIGIAVCMYWGTGKDCIGGGGKGGMGGGDDGGGGGSLEFISWEVTGRFCSKAGAGEF